MPVKDRIVTWWIQNIIIPRQEIIDKPGFVITTFGDPQQTTYLRDIFLPEQLFELIENNLVAHFGEKGKQALYSAGKKFAYLYAGLSNFPSIKEKSEKAVSDFAYLFVRYCEGVFAQEAKHELELDKKLFTISFNDYIICRHNGYGYIMTDGGCAGTWAYLMQDKSIEGTQLECEGRGDQRCYVICAPYDLISNKTNKFFYEKDLSDRKLDDCYKQLNEIREATYAKNSLKDLIDIGFFKYAKGVMSFKGSRFFGCESHILYLIEKEIEKLQNGEKILFDACVEYGKKLQRIYGFADYNKFIMDFFPALGFGDIFITTHNGINITVAYYPWTIFSEESKYIIFRGIMSGFISGALAKKIEFNHFDINIGSYLTLTIKE